MGSLSTHQDMGVVAMSLPTETKSHVALVVTPDAQLRKRCKDSAVNAGYSVEFTENGVSALNLARSLLPDLILLDVELRDVHGLELVTWLRSDPSLRHVPVIAFSAFAGDRLDPRAGHNGVLALLSKPVNTKDIDSWIDRAR